MKYVFLDVDGVLNSEEMLKRNPHPSCHGVVGIDKGKVRLLKKIIDASGAEIVLTSSWKASFDNFKKRHYKAIYLEDGYQFVDELEYCGVLGKYLSNKLYEQKLKVYDTTTRYEDNPNRRGGGILAYLEEHPAEAYAILDDESFGDYRNRSAILDHLVLTDPEVGLTEEDVAEAIEILSR